MPQQSSYDEREIILQVSEGSERAFRSLFELYAKLLFPFLFKTVRSELIAEEIIQETMLRVWMHRDELPGIEFPRQWIFKIASNLAYNTLRRKSLESRIIKEIDQGEIKYVNPDQDQRFKELNQKIQEAVNGMPKERKRIYQLSRDAGMSRQEIAAELGISPSTVKNAIVSALKTIREHLEKAGWLIGLLYLLFIKK